MTAIDELVFARFCEDFERQMRDFRNALAKLYRASEDEAERIQSECDRLKEEER